MSEDPDKPGDKAQAPPREGRRLTARSAARLAAVQGLYQMDMAGTDSNEVVEEFLTHRIAGAGADPGADAAETSAISIADPEFFADTLRGVVRRQREIDPMVDQALATGWRLERIDSILRAILRAGTYELLVRTDVPGRVVINEYIDLAHDFFEGEEPKVVNGVLDRLARRLRPNELEAKGRG